MSFQPVHFYQTGTFTVGNRLLAEEERSVQSDMQRTNSLNSGHRACQGCGEALGARYAIDAAMNAARGRLIAANATGCLEVFSTPYPETSWQIPWIHSLFGNTAAVATGIAAAIKIKKQKGQGKDVRVVAQGGDGGTTDIGFGCLSGMFERNDDVLYICYDNGGYMNTGVQRSSATPPAARTATTMPLGPEPGNASARASSSRPSPWRTRFPTSPPPPWPTCATSNTRSPRPWACAARATSTSWCPARWAGARPRRTPSAWRGWPRKPASSRCSKPSMARSSRRCRYGGRCRSRITCELQKRYAHLFGKNPAVATIARIQALADKNIRKYGLLDQGGELMDKPFAITLNPGSSLANHTGSWRTSRPVYLDRMPPCNHQCPAGEDIQGWLFHAESGNYERPGAT
jgi:pyruvate ferredoxin oxidoreductase beta subunit